MSTKRTYGEACAAAHALDIVGERWALLAVRELLLGPKRFTDLRAGIPHASPNVLAERLRELERHGVVRRRRLGPPSGARVYELTDWGMELEPVICQLGRWGGRSPSRPEDAEMSADSVILAIRTMFDEDAAGGLSASYDLRFGEDQFSVRVVDGRLESAVRGEAPEPDVTIETDAKTFTALLTKAQRLDEAMAGGQLKLTGQAELVERLLEAFVMPEPVELEPALSG
jgi:DNA-binding HxlR family transcriptional regulator